MNHSTCILVIGANRSGTSAVAGVLHKLGVHMGDEFLPPLGENPRGFFEDLQLMRIQHAMLSNDWINPRMHDGYDDRYRQAIAQRSKRGFWGFKDPRTCFTFQKFLKYFQGSIKIVSVHRKSEAVIKSTMKRGMDNVQAAAILNRYLRAKENSMKLARSKNIPIHQVDYDHLIDDTLTEVINIYQFVFDKTIIDGDGINLAPAIEFLTPDLRRNG